MAGPLFRELLESTVDRMIERFPGTEQDIAVTRATSYPLEELTTPTLVVVPENALFGLEDFEEQRLGLVVAAL